MDTPEVEQCKWDDCYEINKYENVFAILDDPKVLLKFEESISNKIKTSKNPSTLIHGCGANINLQKVCAKLHIEESSVIGIDWSLRALDMAKQSAEKNRISINTIEGDFTETCFDDCTFDMVLLSNSIVSSSFTRNIKALEEVGRICSKGGSVIGFFPSAFSMFDYALNTPSASHWLSDGTIDIGSRLIYEESQDMHQRFFTPIELRDSFERLGFKIKRMEIFFFDAPEYKHQLKSLYKIEPSTKHCLWGVFVDAIKI